MNNQRAFDSAQREYDNRTPPDDGPSECPECNGDGRKHAPHDAPGKCETCAGSGLIDDDGQPFTYAGDAA